MRKPTHAVPQQHEILHSSQYHVLSLMSNVPTVFGILQRAHTLVKSSFWGCLRPAELAALGPLAVKIIRLAHVSCPILRVKLSSEEFIRKTKAVPQYSQQ